MSSPEPNLSVEIFQPPSFSTPRALITSSWAAIVYLCKQANVVKGRITHHKITDISKSHPHVFNIIHSKLLCWLFKKKKSFQALLSMLLNHFIFYYGLQRNQLSKRWEICINAARQHLGNEPRWKGSSSAATTPWGERACAGHPDRSLPRKRWPLPLPPGWRGHPTGRHFPAPEHHPLRARTAPEGRPWPE